MTEEEWMACADLLPMLGYLRDETSGRKLRLFACSCCREYTVSPLDPMIRPAVELMERAADGRLREDEEWPRPEDYSSLSSSVRKRNPYYAAFQVTRRLSYQGLR